VGEPGCPVEQIGAWYWRLCDEARHRRAGWVSEPPDLVRMAEIEALETAQERERQAAAERRARRAKMEEALRARR
jgi:hypothetical protein